MDRGRFDALARLVGTTKSRRGLLGVVLGTMVASSGVVDAVQMWDQMVGWNPRCLWSPDRTPMAKALPDLDSFADWFPMAGYAAVASHVDARQLAVLFIAMLLGSSGSAVFNQFYDRDIDGLMPRTAKRPLVNGTAGDARAALLFAAVLLVGGCALAVLAFNWVVAAHLFLGAFVYGVVYTVWLKRRTWWNIVIGGLAGSWAVLAGAAAVEPNLSAEALLLALVLFLWTPPHFWSLAIAYRDDYARAGVPMLPVVKGDRFAARAILAHAVVLVAVSLALAAYSPGWLYALCAVAGGVLLLRHAIALVRAPGRRTAMACFHASLAQLSLVLLGAIRVHVEELPGLLVSEDELPLAIANRFVSFVFPKNRLLSLERLSCESWTERNAFHR